ncbi:hypothetical protein [Polaromonas sp. AET17H-212]|uniref:hypothetical protein n=1 Tax=Polaromonas sp. AET17H-212 TaxID=1977061 RepID=UPI0011412D68|nr:hypothetical protein [Polaromonas sp. AET17H-212]
MKPILTLLEGKWFANRHVSTRDLFVPLFSVWTRNPLETCHHEQFTNEQAFRSAVKYAFQNHRASTIYIGAHGDSRKIHGFHENGISVTVIKNAICKQPPGTKRGIYFGACNFVTARNAEVLLKNCDRLSWVAGYDASVNWTDSGILDLYFFRHLLFPTPGRGNLRPATPKRRLEHAVAKVQDDLGPLATRLKFKVYTRKHGGGVIELMSNDIEEI